MESAATPPAAQGAQSAPPAATAPSAPVTPQQTPPAPPAPVPEEGTYADDKFSREQLVRHARTVVGVEGYVVEVALRHAGSQDYFTKDEAKAAVETLLSSPAGGE